ncbi:MAG: IS1595 family transposase [Proteobacteria bacterium]|nr:IS1595 family transposase [Pseudomonadota bacterium]
MANADGNNPLSGHVEIDETLIGGKKSGPRGRGAAGKTILFGMVERDDKVRAGPVLNVKRKTLQPIILENIKSGSIISTDEFKTYQNLGKLSYEHGVVNHSAMEYARGIHHVNSMEGYWSPLKNSIRGTHIHVSQRHLWKYVSEFSFRYNMRKKPGAMFPFLVASLELPHLKDD